MSEKIDELTLLPQWGTPASVQVATAINEACLAFLANLDRIMTSGRDRSLVITKLQELAFFASRSALTRLAAKTGEAS